MLVIFIMVIWSGIHEPNLTARAAAGCPELQIRLGSALGSLAVVICALRLY